MSYLSAITRSRADNPGGIITLQVARRADVESMPEPVDGVIYGDITFAAGAGWITWEVTFESIRISSDDRLSREGFATINNMPFRIPRDIPGIRSMLNLAAEDEFLVLFRDSAGRAKIFGLPEAPARLAFSHDGGQGIADGNFYTARFFYEGPDNINFYEGDIPIAPGAGSPAVVKFNGTPIASLQPGEVLNIESEFGFQQFFITS